MRRRNEDRAEVEPTEKQYNELRGEESESEELRKNRIQKAFYVGKQNRMVESEEESDIEELEHAKGEVEENKREKMARPDFGDFWIQITGQRIPAEQMGTLTSDTKITGK